MTKSCIDPAKFGVTFSIKQCRNFSVDPDKALAWLIKQGFRRFRLMSYWNEHEKQPGVYDFTDLDAQITLIEKAGGVITLCLGARQPRWPESHWPEWAWKADKPVRSAALLDYIATVVERYRSRDCIVSYQLENEALLLQFGKNPEVDRDRLRQEYLLIKLLDPTRPIAMSTSTSWGIPVRQPIPDIVAFSYYRIIHGKGGYSKAFHTPLLHRTRKFLVKQLLNRPVFIHELQLEPWVPGGNTPGASKEEQDKSMSPAIIQRNIQLAKKVKAVPIDLWGGEWWYWRHMHRDTSIWKAVKAGIDAK
ncbi:beta-galactosidase [Aeromicrobium sp.]|nr:beta-galactosidase [Candidatus Saccharibacteria bacterium]